MEKRTVLRLDKRLAPVKAAVLPLSRNADLSPKARDLAGDAAQALERRVRRRAGDRPPLPPPGRDRHAVLRHRRLRHPRRRRGDGPRARHDDPGAGRRSTRSRRYLARAAGCWDAEAGCTAVSGRAAASRRERVVAEPPVVLAPMAGITNTAFRRLCREDGTLAGAGGCSSSEMITTRALVERNPKTMQLIRFEPDETPRSIQLYGVDPAVVGAAVRMIVEEDLADHIDLNFGCPVPKVTRKGGGSALPWRIGLFDDIVRAAVRERRRRCRSR